MTRKALGRGLSALLDDAQKPFSALQEIPLGRIDPNPFQPRRAMAPDRLKELTDSILASGVVQPVVVRRSGDRYQLVAGERRWRAARAARLESIPAVVREISDEKSLELALTENLLREELSPIEAARAYQVLHERFGHSHEVIAAGLGLDRSTVSNSLRLLKLPVNIQQMIESRELSAGHARAILACSTVESQIQLAEQIIKDGLSVRRAERIASAKRSEPSDDIGENGQPTDPNVRAAAVELERMLGTRVKITGDGARGRIEISYYSAEDLNRLYDYLLRK